MRAPETRATVEIRGSHLLIHPTRSAIREQVSGIRTADTQSQSLEDAGFSRNSNLLRERSPGDVIEIEPTNVLGQNDLERSGQTGWVFGTLFGTGCLRPPEGADVTSSRRRKRRSESRTSGGGVHMNAVRRLKVYLLAERDYPEAVVTIPEHLLGDLPDLVRQARA